MSIFDFLFKIMKKKPNGLLENLLLSKMKEKNIRIKFIFSLFLDDDNLFVYPYTHSFV